MELPEGLERIGMYAFQETGLRELSLPGSLRAIGQGAFYGCRRFRSARFANGPEPVGEDAHTNEGQSYYGAFQGSGLERVRLPATLKRVEYWAFRDCARLWAVILPAGLECLGRQCFWGAGLREVALPRGSRAEEDAFWPSVARKVVQ